jgi:nucleotide-binding universal stress UspA family protein
MYHTILVPLDGSAFAEQALPLALMIARRAGASLRLVHVHAVYVQPDATGALLPFSPELDVQCQQQERTYLDGVVRHLAETSTVPVTAGLGIGPAADGVLEEARARKADLIVMTTHGHGPWSRFWLGSVADQLVRRASVPVLLLREHAPATPPSGEPSFRHMLVPLDGSHLAEQVLEPAVALGKLLGMRYTLVQVVEPVIFRGSEVAGSMPGAVDLTILERREVEARAYLDRVAGRLRGQSLDVETRVVVGEPAAAAVLDVARIAAADLVALATHGRGGLKRLLLGSVADKVVRGAHVPVLVHRPARP